MNQKATAYFNNNGTESAQEETQPDPELNTTWNKLVLPISNDTMGYTMTTVEAFTHGNSRPSLHHGAPLEPFINDMSTRRLEMEVRELELKVQVRLPSYIKRRPYDAKHEKTRLRNYTYLDSA